MPGLQREAQAMGRLGAHPHIVTVFDIGEENGQPYLVLPVLAGGDVEGVIEKAPENKLTIERAVKIALDTCLGLVRSISVHMRPARRDQIPITAQPADPPGTHEPAVGTQTQRPHLHHLEPGRAQ